jgi:hypothetical protein
MHDFLFPLEFSPMIGRVSQQLRSRPWQTISDEITGIMIFISPTEHDRWEASAAPCLSSPDLIERPSIPETLL